MTARTLLAGAAALVLGCGALVALPTDDSKMTQASSKTGSTGSTYSASGYDLTPPTPERKAELVSKLTAEQRRITQAEGTEAAFCGTLLDNKKDGTYLCVVCNLPLFKSEHKFTSGTGWPSFYTVFDPKHVAEKTDTSYGMVRTEIECARCEAHLGHVFEDGPRPTGLRYCLNSASLEFVETGDEMPEGARPVELQTAYFAGGCFWGIEYAFSKYPGVVDSVSGYQNGDTENPTYKEVCSGTTNHAESVKVTFDPNRVSYEKLVEFFFRIHDPTQLNRQGPDYGTQYRSGIFTVNDDQAAIARRVAERMAAEGRWGDRKVVTVIEPTETFYKAEDYHQDYNEKTGRSCHVDVGRVLKELGLAK